MKARPEKAATTTTNEGEDSVEEQDHDGSEEVNGHGDSEGEDSVEGENHHGSEDRDDDRDADDDGRQSSAAAGSAKPLASVAGQTSAAVPVEGLEGALQVEVTHVASGAARTMDLHAVLGEPGHYTAALIPTAAGVYEFRVFGEIEGMPVDETFVSEGAGGDFDDIRTSAELQFPVQLPEIREIESGVRGALQTAQQAQDAALAAQEGGSNTLAIVALIVGIAGTVLGAGGIFMGLRGRQS